VLGADLEVLHSPDFLSLIATEEELAGFIKFGHLHHVEVRALDLLPASAIAGVSERAAAFCANSLATEKQRISHAIAYLENISQKLDAACCPAVVIKSLDHYPDLGSDLDMYSSGDEKQIVAVMAAEFNAQLMPRSWGDRLAHKWNFSVPGLPEALEIHVGCLGQTGEHLDLGRRVLDRAMQREIEGHTFRVAAPEERVMIMTLQRMYRHFYFRLCDIVDTKNLIQQNLLDYDQLQRAAQPSGIWPGVATFLEVVAEYCNKYGTTLQLPQQVLSASRSSGKGLVLKDHFLRIPMIPDAAGLFLSQMSHAGSKIDLRTVGRLSLLPALATAALVSFKLTGDDKGIW
jgi:hypothetical protein